MKIFLLFFCLLILFGFDSSEIFKNKTNLYCACKDQNIKAVSSAIATRDTHLKCFRSLDLEINPNKKIVQLTFHSLQYLEHVDYFNNRVLEKNSYNYEDHNDRIIFKVFEKKDKQTTYVLHKNNGNMTELEDLMIYSDEPPHLLLMITRDFWCKLNNK